MPFQFGMFNNGTYVPSFRIKANENIVHNAFDVKARRVIENDEKFKEEFSKLEKTATRIFYEIDRNSSINFFKDPAALLTGVLKRVIDKWVEEEKKVLHEVKFSKTTSSTVYPENLCRMTMYNFEFVEQLFVLIKKDFKSLHYEHMTEEQRTAFKMRNTEKNYRSRQKRKEKKLSNNKQ